MGDVDVGGRVGNTRHSWPRSRGVWLLVLTMVLLLTSAGSALLKGQAAGSRTVWDGVYTEAQAERATVAFSQSCSRCHTLEAQGDSPLSGEKFWEGFTQRTVEDLLTYVRTNMPNGNGGSLPASTYNDLVALILKSNGFPTGAVELAPESITGVQIIPKSGPGELPANTLVRVIGCLARDGNEWVVRSATAPERVERIGLGTEDATRPLGDRTTTLKFVLTPLDSLAGRRVSVSGLLMGAGGADGINVSTVNRVGDTCP
ncbi:MAG TPA: cytochrome c [Vicinamibacterales bacterium]|nr:cytochrome c [Vicinamibacterales bacterium]